MKQRNFRILSETTVERKQAAGDAAEAEAEADENPYWSWDEQEPHPDPSLGCVRRGLCCKSSPGWFGPGEVEQAAALLEMTPDELVRRYLVVDETEVDGERVFVFAPLKLGVDGEPAIPPASRADALYRALRGQCVFFEGGGCGIYEARPIECRRYICTNKPSENMDHQAIARLWLRAGQ